MAHTLPPGYFVTQDGRVFSQTPWRGQAFRELRQFPHKDGYLTVRVTTGNGKRKRLTVHRLVALYFVGRQPSPRHEVRHIDGNKTHNHYRNLVWGTPLENARDRDVHGRTSRGMRHSEAIKNGLRQSKEARQ